MTTQIKPNAATSISGNEEPTLTTNDNNNPSGPVTGLASSALKTVGDAVSALTNPATTDAPRKDGDRDAGRMQQAVGSAKESVGALLNSQVSFFLLLFLQCPKTDLSKNLTLETGIKGSR